MILADLEVAIIIEESDHAGWPAYDRALAPLFGFARREQRHCESLRRAAKAERNIRPWTKSTATISIRRVDMARFLKPLLYLVVACNPAGLLAVSAAFATGMSASYHIGNSLTNDMAPFSFGEFAAQRGLTHTAGYHIRSSSSLLDIMTNPDSLSVTPPEPFGNFVNALPNFKWNAVTIQPHTGMNSTMATDVDAILSLINLARSNPENLNTRFYIYSTWPKAGSFQEKWTASVVDDESTPSTRSGEYFSHLLNRVRAETDATVLMVPVGDVLNELDIRLSAGLVPGYSGVSSFYRDAQHMKGGLGGYTAALTTFATIRAQEPLGLVKPLGVLHFDNDPFNAELIYAAINDAVHDVVGTHPYSGVEFPNPTRADFDQSGVVDQADLALLETSLGKSAVADANDDGDVNSDDLAIMLSQMGLNARKTSNFDPSDVNQDGLTDSFDLDVWRQSTGVNVAYDLDGDGDTDGNDFLGWQRGVTQLYAGDFNRDYVVDPADFNVWEANNGFTIRTDANGDGVVDMADYAIWQEEEGRVYPLPPPFLEASAVPEPCGALLAATALGVLAHASRARRQRR